jgi:hypothetical protein
MKVKNLFENLFIEDDVRKRGRIEILKKKIENMKDNLKRQMYTHSYSEMQKETIKRMEDELEKLKGG